MPEGHPCFSLPSCHPAILPIAIALVALSDFADRRMHDVAANGDSHDCIKLHATAGGRGG